MNSLLKNPTQSRFCHTSQWITKLPPWVILGIPFIIYGFQTLFYHDCLKRILAAESWSLAMLEIIRIFLEQIEWFFLIAAACFLSGVIIGIMTEIIRRRKNDHRL